MSSPFFRTLRSLERRSFRGSRLTSALALVLGAGSLLWLLKAPVAVYESTPIARVEVCQTAPWVEAQVDGLIVTSHVVLGQRVAAGQVLLELDCEDQELELRAQQATRSALERQLEALRRQLTATRDADVALGQAKQSMVAEARARRAAATARDLLAADERSRIAAAHAAGQISELERVRLDLEVTKSGAEVDAAGLELDRLEAERAAEQELRRSELAELEREISDLEGKSASCIALCDRLSYEIELRRLRAPIAGAVADLADLKPGMAVRRGTRVATILPDDGLKVVAEFQPAVALGRIRPGQRARFRLDGFPWSQYGSLQGTVLRVASEIRHGQVRVELAVDPAPPKAVPLEHGLSGTIEIEVEKVAPITLALRRISHLLSSSGPLSAAVGPPATLSVRINGHQLVAEIAADPLRRTVGLMERRQLHDDQGMLFVYGESRQLSFWMRNTFIPLSIAFLDMNGRILNIENMAPFDEQPHLSAAPARFALEARQGWFDARGIVVGDRCTFDLPSDMRVQ